MPTYPTPESEGGGDMRFEGGRSVTVGISAGGVQVG